MKNFDTIIGITMIAIGLFLSVFYGFFIKRKEEGPGLDTPEKRIALYGAVGIGAMFIGAGLIFLIACRAIDG